MRFIRAIPSWVVGACGATLVVFSVTLGSVCVRHLDASSNAVEAAIGEVTSILDRRSRQHNLARSRAESADLLAALAVDAVQDGNRPNLFLVERAGFHLGSAIRMMWVAAPGEKNIELEALSSAVDDLEAKLNGGDLTAYLELTEILADRVIRSNRAIAELRQRIKRHEAQLQASRYRVNRIRDMQAGLNIIGLVIVLLKDLPIWGNRKRVR